MHIPRLIRRFLPAAILIVVALWSIYQHKTLDRSAWGTGCAFGMFSTVEYHGTRFIRCYATTANGSRQLEGPKRLSLRTRALPTQANLRKLADVLSREAQRRWETTSKVRVELWRTGFHGPSGTLTFRLTDATEMSVNNSLQKTASHDVATVER